MSTYFSAVAEQLKDWKKAVLVLVFTVARIIYGYAWVEAGWEKATSDWMTFAGGKSAKLIGGMAANMAPPKAHGWDPLYINKLWAWVATNVFNGMPGVTDFIVPVTEIFIGLAMILGIRIFWTAILALFLNVQFAAAGSANNFGYIWTNIIFMNVAKYAEFIGVSGFLRHRKGQNQLETNACCQNAAR